MFVPHYTPLLFVCRLLRQLKHASALQNVNRHTTIQLSRSVKLLLMHDLLPVFLHLHSLLFPLVPPFPLEVDLLAYAIDLIFTHRFTTLPIPLNRAQYSSKLKCAIFGICCEGILRQVNYLVNEVLDMRKGGNTVVSIIHLFLSTNSLGKIRLLLQADN